METPMYFRSYISLTLIAFVATPCLSAPTPVSLQAAPHVSTYPAFAPGQTTYVVPPAEANLIIDSLAIPTGSTVKAGPGVQSINWVVSTFSFGTNATLDLGAAQAKAPGGANGAGPPGQAGYCIPGGNGAPGANGIPGLPGVDLTISGITTVNNSGTAGSLWIKTDGGPGSDGGNGGRGQQGGGQQKFWAHFNLHTCHAGNGGAGGTAGLGGTGGRVANVTITFAIAPAPVQMATGVAATCSPSQRPPAVQGATGNIVVWGATGCPGTNGQRGADGGAG